MTEPALDDLQVLAFLRARGPPQFEARVHRTGIRLTDVPDSVIQAFYSAPSRAQTTNLNNKTTEVSMLKVAKTCNQSYIVGHHHDDSWYAPFHHDRDGSRYCLACFLGVGPADPDEKRRAGHFPLKG
jgi:hypothetical protein